MKTNPSVAMTGMRRVVAAATFTLGGGAGLFATPPTAEMPAQEPSARCGACSEPSPILVLLECHDRADLAARLSPRETRAHAAPVRRLTLELAGLDLLASQPGELRTGTTATATTERSPFDFAPGARAVGPLRWTWASVAWKF